MEKEFEEYSKLQVLLENAKASMKTVDQEKAVQEAIIAIIKALGGEGNSHVAELLIAYIGLYIQLNKIDKALMCIESSFPLNDKLDKGENE